MSNRTPIAELPPEYEDRIVAWVDVLGWSALIRATELDRSARLPIAEAVALIAHTRESLKHPHPLELAMRKAFPHLDYVEPTFSHFSDTYVISGPATDEGWLAVTFAAQSLAYGLLKAGHLTRGALVRGLVHHSDNALYGPAVLEAYDIEQRVAKYPRIMVTTEALAVPQEHHFVTRDADGLNFLDILWPWLSRGPAIQELRELEHRISSQADARRRDLDVSAKYGWLLRHLRERIALREEAEPA